MNALVEQLVAALYWGGQSQWLSQDYLVRQGHDITCNDKECYEQCKSNVLVREDLGLLEELIAAISSEKLAAFL